MPHDPHYYFVESKVFPSSFRVTSESPLELLLTRMGPSCVSEDVMLRKLRPEEQKGWGPYVVLLKNAERRVIPIDRSFLSMEDARSFFGTVYSILSAGGTYQVKPGEDGMGLAVILTPEGKFI